MVYIAHADRVYFQSPATSPELERIMTQMADATAVLQKAAADLRATAETMTKIKAESTASLARIEALMAAKANLEAQVEEMKAGGVALSPEFLAALKETADATAAVQAGAQAVDILVPDATPG